jgi:uncharacterized protein YndB with AHSA1/START domain
MSRSNLTYAFTVDQSPQQAYEAILNMRGWWSQTITGDTRNLMDVMNYEVEGVHKTRMQLVQLIPNQKVVWHVLENWLSFVEDKTEWVDTNLVFTISEKDGQTEVEFIHVGLTPSDECYDICLGAWGGYITNSLRQLIESGTGVPNQETEEILEPLRASVK